MSFKTCPSRTLYLIKPLLYRILIHLSQTYENSHCLCLKMYYIQIEPQFFIKLSSAYLPCLLTTVQPHWKHQSLECLLNWQQVSEHAQMSRVIFSHVLCKRASSETKKPKSEIQKSMASPVLLLKLQKILSELCLKQNRRTQPWIYLK